MTPHLQHTGRTQGRPDPGHLPTSLLPPPSDAEGLTYTRNLQRVRRFVAAKSRDAGLSALRSADLVLAISELAANTLRHTGGPGTLHLWRTPSEIICQISDSGEISDPDAGRSRPTHAGRGLGLWVVHQVCDSVQIRTGPEGTVIQVHMAID